MIYCLPRVYHIKNLRLIYCFLFLGLCLPAALIAQITSRIVSGEIRDSKKSPLQGVSVTVKGSFKGTASGTDERFVLNSGPANGVLVFRL